MKIRDQRTMIGSANPASVDEVGDAWNEYAAANGFDARLRGEETGRIFELRTVTESVHARVEHGRWIADCPSPTCASGAAAWPENPNACCLDCGTIFPVEFPHPNTVRAVEPVLAARAEHEQSWFPELETVDDLKAENVVHGVVPSVELARRDDRAEIIRDVAAKMGIEIPKRARTESG